MSVHSKGRPYEDRKGMAIKEPRMLAMEQENMITAKCVLSLRFFLSKMVQADPVAPIKAAIYPCKGGLVLLVSWPVKPILKNGFYAEQFFTNSQVMKFYVNCRLFLVWLVTLSVNESCRPCFLVYSKIKLDYYHYHHTTNLISNRIFLPPKKC